MKNLNCCIFLFLAVASLAAPADDCSWMAKIRPVHPRMFFNAETWPQVKARAEGPARAARDALLKRCDGYPADPKCSGTEAVTLPAEFKNAASSMPIPPVKEWGGQAAECALAWRFTGERKYLDKARRMLESSVAAYHAAYANRRAVNWYSTSRILALCAYDWIWEGLTPDERKAIIVPLVQHVEDIQPGKGKPAIVRRDAGGIKSGFYGVPSLLWYSGLAAFGDGYCDNLAESQLRRGHDLCLKLLEFRNGGADDDGLLSCAVPAYSICAYPWAHFNFFHTWLSATGENLAPRYPALALLPNWIWWVWIRGGEDGSLPLVAGFGDDSHTQNELPGGRVFEHMTQVIHFYRDVNPAAARLAASLRELAPNSSLGDQKWPMNPFLLDIAGNGVEPYPLAELENAPIHARHFPSAGQFYLRSGWKGGATYATFTAGADITMHKHYDENNFTIYKHDFLALDSGTRGEQSDTCLTYYYAQTVAHNCILIHRPGERLPTYWGPRLNDESGVFNHGGMYSGSVAKVLAFETNDAYTYIASDATKPYGEKCREAVRQFVHILPDVFVVYDRVGAADPSYRKEWLLHTKDEPRIKGRLTTADCGKGRIFCETVLPEDAKLAKVGGPGKEFWASGRNWSIDPKYVEGVEKHAKSIGHGPYFGAWRLEVSPGMARENDRFLHVVTASDTAMLKPPTVRKVSGNGCDGVVVEVPKADGGATEVKVLFSREGAVGGTITFGNDAPRPFATTVQPQSGVWPTATVARDASSSSRRRGK